MAEDSSYTQRQKAQSYLIRHLDEVHRITGRTAGFDSNTVTHTLLGPPAVAITRVVSDGRTATGKSMGTGPVSVADGNTILNSATPSRYLDIFDPTVPEDEIDNLIPDIKLFKVYPGSGRSEDEKFEIEFSNEWLGEGTTEFTTKVKEYNAKQKTAQDWERHFSTLGDAPKVGITGLTIKKLGGNPAEVESNIQVSITIETMNLNNLFFRHLPHPDTLPAHIKEKWKNAIDKGELPNGIAWIDLIQMNPNATLANGACDRIYDEEETQIKLQVGYTVDDDELRKKAIMQSVIGTSVAHEEIDHAWVDEMATRGKIGQPGSKDYQDFLDIADRNESGEPHPAPSLSDAAQEVIDIINGQKETYHLVLQNHELTVDPDLGVRMTVNFIGYGEAMQRTNKADLLGDPNIVAELQAMNDEMDRIAQSTAALRTQADIDEMPETNEKEKAAKEEAKATNKYKESCANDLDEKSKVFEKEYEELLLISKRTLHDQIKLAGPNYDTSRIYDIAVPDTDPIWSEARPGTTKGAQAPIIKNYMASWDASKFPDPNDYNPGWKKQLSKDADRFMGAIPKDAGGIKDTLEGVQTGLLKEVVEAGSTEAPYSVSKYTKYDPQEGQRDELLSNIQDRLGYKFFKFVFLGDIVEAALEVLAKNDHPPAYPKSSYVHGQGVAFFSEIDKKGRLGEKAQKTIKRHGKYIFGDIKLPQLVGEDEPKYINIADIPIEFEQFRTFWYNEVVSRPNVKKYFLKNLINGLINTLIPYAIDNRASLTANSKDNEGAQAIATYYSVSGRPTDLNTEVSKADLPPPKTAQELKQEIVDLQALAQHASPPSSGILNSGTPLHRGAAEAVLDKQIADAACKPPPDAADVADDAASQLGGSLLYAGYLGQKSLSYRVNRSHEAAVANDTQATYNVFAVTQKPSSTMKRGMGADPQGDDKRDGVPWFELSSGPKGMLISAQFKRSDLPGLREANLMADGGINKLGILREKYDATVLLRGNVAFKPGSVVYINPDSLASAIDPPTHLLNGGSYLGDGLAIIPPPFANAGKAVSAARTLGLGGYFVVITVSHDFGDLGNNPDWKTTLETRWLSFAHLPGFEACGIKKPKDSVALSPDDEACVTGQQEAAAAAATAKAAKAAKAAAAEAAAYDEVIF
jgi:hypothetical protein